MFTLSLEPSKVDSKTLLAVATMLNSLADAKGCCKSDNTPAEVSYKDTVTEKTPVKTLAIGPEFPEPSADFLEATDSAGFPWDERIHSSSKKTNQDGTWKARRKVDPEFRKEVEAELVGVEDPGVLPEQPVEEPPVQDPATVFGGNKPVESTPVTGFGDPYPELLPAPVTSVTDLKWPDFLGKLIEARRASALDETKLTALMVADGIKGGIPLLAQRNDLWVRYLTELGLA